MKATTIENPKCHYSSEKGYYTTYDQLDLDSLENHYSGSNKVGYERKKRLSWKNDNPDYQKAIRSGVLAVDQSAVCSDYIDWVSENNIVTLRSWKDHKKIRFLSPKRGNYTYSIKKQRQILSINECLEKYEFSWKKPKTRNQYQTLVLLITVTVAQNPNDRYERQRYWLGMTKELNKFRYKVTRKVKASSAAMTCKESHESGYPHAHSLLILNVPITVYKALNKKGEVYYGLHDEKLRSAIKSYWPYGNVDIKGVVNVQKNVSYITKYMTKGLHSKASKQFTEAGFDSLSKDDKKCLLTNTWTKLFNLRPLQISKQFKNMINLRLDRIISQSQHTSYYYVGSEYKTNEEWYKELQEIVKKLKENQVLPPPSPNDPRNILLLEETG